MTHAICELRHEVSRLDDSAAASALAEGTLAAAPSASEEHLQYLADATARAMTTADERGDEHANASRRSRSTTLQFAAFDLLSRNEHRLTNLSYDDRRRLLASSTCRTLRASRRRGLATRLARYSTRARRRASRASS